MSNFSWVPKNPFRLVDDHREEAFLHHRIHYPSQGHTFGSYRNVLLATSGCVVQLEKSKLLDSIPGKFSHDSSQESIGSERVCLCRCSDSNTHSGVVTVQYRIQ